MKGGKIRTCFPMIRSCCCDVHETNDRSAARHGAERQQTCVGCRSLYEDGVWVRKRLSGVVARKTEAKKKITEKQAGTSSLGGQVVVQRDKRYRAR